MNKKEQENINEQKNLDKFNSITHKSKPENQNQKHNARKEGLQPINQKRWKKGADSISVPLNSSSFSIIVATQQSFFHI